MRHARVMGLAGLAVLAVGAVAFAQTTVVPVPDNAPVETAPLDINLAKTTWGDAKAGQTKAAACAACHGAAGNPSDPQYARLAGLVDEARGAGAAAANPSRSSSSANARASARPSSVGAVS